MVYFWYAFFGLVFGFALSCVGFTRYDELHKMWLFQDLRLMLTFMGVVGINMLFLPLLRKRHAMRTLRITRGTIPGGLLFGVGWALSGACPAVVLVQLGEGQMPALITFVGISIGITIYPSMHARFFRFDPGTCSD